MPNHLLEISNLTAGYEGLHVLHGLDLFIEAGEALALVGANGAGKTTTLRAIMGLIHISSGEIRMEERLLSNMRTPDIAKTGVAMVPEGREVFPSLTVEENLNIGFWASKRKDIHAKYQEAYNLFPRLEERRHQKAGTLSGGEQQMLAVARALMSSPRLILIDEPSMGLAPIIVDDVYQALEKVNKLGTAILLVEQNVRLALNVCHRGYVLERGRIVLHGNSQELSKHERVIEAYLGIASA